MKKLFGAMAVLIILALFSVNVQAYSDKTTQSIAEEAGADKIENSNLSRDELSGDKKINLFQKVWQIICQSFGDRGLSVVKSMGLILGLLIICCVMHALRFDNNEALDTAAGFISVLALSGAVYSVLYNLFVFVIASMETVTLTMSSLLPIMATLYSYGGTVSAGSAAGSGLTVFLSVLSLICTKVILPLLQISFALALTGALPGSINLSGVTNLVKNTATVIMGFIFTLLSFLLYFQTTVAASADNFVARSVRFASGTFVPVIGGMLGDASRTVAASVSVIKGTVGTAGIVAVLSMVLPAVIITLLYKLMLLVCSVVAKSIGCDRESALLYDLGGILNLLLALVLGAGCVCIIGFAVFIKTGVNI